MAVFVTGGASLTLVLMALIGSTTAYAQDVDIPPARYPTLATNGASVEAFVPNGWRIARSASGDLNGDNLADTVIVLQEQDSAKVVVNDGLGAPKLDTNPRMLAVLFREAGPGYRLAASDRNLIPRWTDPVAEDPFDDEDSDLAIVRGTLRLTLYHFMSAGGADMGPISFTFRWQENALRLIGYDSTIVQRMSGKITSRSINYVTRRAKIGSGSIENDKQVERWLALPARPLLTIDQVGNGMDFDPGADDGQ